MVKKPHIMYSQTSARRSRPKWKAMCTAPTALLRSRMRMLETPLAKKERIARMRKAQGRPRLLIMALVASEYTRPPKPEPLVDKALANDRRLLNHWGTTPTLAVKQKPMPIPKQMPWLRSRCQTAAAKEAPTKDT